MSSSRSVVLHAGQPVRQRQRGFTLMELVVTLALLGVLALLAAPLSEMALRRTKEAALRQALHDIRGAIDRYKVAVDQGLIERKMGDSGYPPSLALLVGGVVNQKSLKKERLYFLRRIPRDPFAPPEGPPENTWGLRSYASPPDSPFPGNDVFDVRSLSKDIGLNGIPYEEW